MKTQPETRSRAQLKTSLLPTLAQLIFATVASASAMEPMDIDDEPGLSRLTPELIRLIAISLDPTFNALSFKLASKATAASLREQYYTVELAREPRRQFSVVLHSPTDSHLYEPALAHPAWPGPDFVAHWGRPEPWRSLNRRERHRLLCLAASCHHVPSLDAALAHCGTVIKADALASAAAAGDLQTCQRLLLGEGCHWQGNVVVTAAARAGHIHMCDWLARLQASEVGGTRNLRHIALAACFCGQRAVFEWARAECERIGPVVREAVKWATAAAEGGHIGLLQVRARVIASS